MAKLHIEVVFPEHTADDLRQLVIARDFVATEMPGDVIGSRYITALDVYNLMMEDAELSDSCTIESTIED